VHGRGQRATHLSGRQGNPSDSRSPSHKTDPSPPTPDAHPLSAHRFRPAGPLRSLATRSGWCWRCCRRRRKRTSSCRGRSIGACWRRTRERAALRQGIEREDGTGTTRLLMETIRQGSSRKVGTLLDVKGDLPRPRRGCLLFPSVAQLSFDSRCLRRDRSTHGWRESCFCIL
jgi:hypothetical protein